MALKLSVVEDTITEDIEHKLGSGIKMEAKDTKDPKRKRTPSSEAPPETKVPLTLSSPSSSSVSSSSSSSVQMEPQNSRKQQPQVIRKAVTRGDTGLHSMEDFVEVLKVAKRIVVVSGAGISVSCGIPDFRSKDTGLYNTLDCHAFGIPSAELLFDLEFFNIDPEPFYKFAKVLLPTSNVKPSPCHRFIHKLDQSKKLLKCYTQNIDGIERRMGISKKTLIECHGSMETFRCQACNKKVASEKVKDTVRSGKVPYCGCKNEGVLKPDITFFGEELPIPFMSSLNEKLLKADLVLVMGTSLKVGGSVHAVLSMIGGGDGTSGKVPFVLFNREPVVLPACITRGFDLSILGHCDHICAYLDELYSKNTVATIGGGDSDGDTCYECTQTSERTFSVECKVKREQEKEDKGAAEGTGAKRQRSKS